MTTTPSLRLVLEPTPEVGRIAGSLYDQRGERHAFTSWPGVLTVLEDAPIRVNSSTPEESHCEAAVASDHYPPEER